MSSNKSVFQILSAIDCKQYVKQKGKLDYLPWAKAWELVKGLYPDTSFKVYENEHGMNYFTDNRTAWVKVSTTINENELIEYLPIMDFKNKSTVIDAVTSVDVNKAIKRALVKSLAGHGLALYLYNGEDLPEESKLLSVEEVEELEKLITDTNSDKEKLLKFFRINNLNEANYQQAKTMLEKKLNKEA